MYLQERVIKSAFDKNKKNLSLTAKELDHVKGDMKTKRYQQTLSYEDIPFAQEVAFIKHRLEIRDYLSSIKQKERLEFEQCQVLFFKLQMKQKKKLTIKSSNLKSDNTICTILKTYLYNFD